MFRTIQSLVRSAYGDKILTIDEWATRNSKICSAEDLIVASIVNSIAKNFDGWVNTTLKHDDVQKILNKYPNMKYAYINYELKRKDDGLMFHYRMNSYGDTFMKDNCFVDGVEISGDGGAQIYNAWEKIKNERRRIERLAMEAKREMEKNEAKWNLAEKLLGMKRNEFGALEPIGD